MSAVKTSFFQELKRYSLDDIGERLKCTPENAKTYINTLLKYGILKITKKDSPEFADLTNDDIVIADSAEENLGECYKFDFVGIAVVKDKVFFCYPKYIIDTDIRKIRNELKLAIRAVQIYSSKGEQFFLHNWDNKGEYNKLALSLHIMQDYIENDVYTNVQEVIETNGEGEIDWDRTIDETFAYVRENRPYYLELKTRSSQNDNSDYFKRLHECIVTQCSKYLKELTILDFFDMPEVFLSELELKDFGDTDYILYRLEREIANQFVTRKQNLLKTLYTFVATSGTSSQENSYSLYGTNSMNLVWQDACGVIFGNIYKNVEAQIAKPQWYLNDNRYEAAKSLIPDIITECNIEYEDDYEKVFCILDAKYYIVKAENISSGKGIPGVQDIVKQFAYHESFLGYLSTKHCESVFNAFLLPKLHEGSEQEPITIRGFVTMLKWGVEQLVPIYLVFLDPSFVWQNYLSGSIKKDVLINSMKKIQLKDVLGNAIKFPDMLKNLSNSRST